MLKRVRAGRDIIVATTTIIISVLPEPVARFLAEDGLFLVVSLVVQIMVIAMWSQYAARFLLTRWLLLGCMSLLEIALLAGYRWMDNRSRRWWAVVAIGAVLALAALVGVQYNSLAFPQRYPNQDFVVAVAQLGEGPAFQNTEQARAVSSRFFESLERQIAQNKQLPSLKLHPLGLVRNQQEATEDALRIGADLVIWGYLQTTGAGTALSFAIVETPDKVTNPTFSRVLPLLDSAASDTVVLSGREEKDIAQGTTTIAAFTQGLALLFRWDFRNASNAFEEALSASSETDKDRVYQYLLRLYYGQSLQWPGLLDKANEQFAQAMVLQPEDPAAPLAMAFGYRALGKPDEARVQAQTAWRLCNEHLKSGRELDRVFFDRALANEILEDWRSALNDYQSALKAAPELFVARLGVIRMHLLLNEVDEALGTSKDTIEWARGISANPAWAYLYLAQAHERKNEADGAFDAYKQATALAPDIDWIRFQAGRFYASIGDKDAAEEEYQEMIRVTSNPAWAHSTLAKFYDAHNQLAAAVREFKEALQWEPDAALTWVDLADLYAKTGQNDEAKRAYVRAVTTQTDSYYAHYRYGKFLHGQNDLKGAAEQWEAARRAKSDNCEILVNLGGVYEALQESDKAREVYSQASQLKVDGSSGCVVEAQRRLEALPH